MHLIFRQTIKREIFLHSQYSIRGSHSDKKYFAANIDQYSVLNMDAASKMCILHTGVWWVVYFGYLF